MSNETINESGQDEVSARNPVVTERQVAQRIRDWFQGEKNNVGWEITAAASDDIDALIAAMAEPLPEVAAAWKQWNEFENSCERAGDVGHYHAMDLCAYTEWCSEFALGRTTEEFEGVPRIVISVVPFVPAESSEVAF